MRVQKCRQITASTLQRAAISKWDYDSCMSYQLLCFYRTRVRSLVMLVTHWLTNWLTNWLLFSKLDWCDVWLVKMPTQNLLRLLLLLMLMMRNVLTTVVCRFGSWSLVMKLNFVQTLSTRFGQEFEVEVQAKFWNWSLVSILLLSRSEVMKWMFGQDFEVKVWSKCWCLVEILNFGIWSRFV